MNKRRRGAQPGNTNAKRHGMARTPEYKIWDSLRGRCDPRLASKRPCHAGRGVRVCERWQGPGGFTRFFADMGARPGPDYSIDRIDNDGDYTPSNCRWATRKQQARNRRSGRLLTCGGRTLTLAEWVEVTGLRRHTIVSRLKHGWSPEKALTTPSRRYTAG